MIGVVWSRFNESITSKFRGKVVSRCRSSSLSFVEASVPSAFAIPLVVKKLLKLNEVTEAISLGCLLAGDSKKNEVIAHCVAKQLLELSCEFEKPVSFGVIGPGVSEQQALERVERYAIQSLEEVVENG